MNEKIFSITRACAFTDQIFLKFLEEAKKNSFKTELDIAKFINSQIEFLGLKKSFPTIVATGKNAVDWHHKPTKTIIKKGFCVIDFGIKVNGYCSDMTRTIYFGKANNKEKKIYAKVLKANLETIKMVKEATDGNLIYKHAKKVLGKLSKYFGHGLGHGLSKKIHDKPRLSKKPGEILKNGDIITIEPGVYIPKKFGIRIEDDVLVLENSQIVLTLSEKKLIEIPLTNQPKNRKHN
ncbi:MAG: M24 family metallopeptidase [Candidatus Diapherotrites archaeon]